MDPYLAWGQAGYNWVLQLLIQFRLFVYLVGKNDNIVVPPNTANPISNNINDDLITVTTTSRGSHFGYP
jgi:hypothetical protein